MSDELSSVEETVAEVVATELGRIAVLDRDRSVSLTELGADSLNAVEIEMELEKRFDLRMPRDWMSESSSIRNIGCELWRHLPT